MGSATQLQQTVDPTGALSQLDLNTQDISNIMDQFNTLQDNLTGGNITQNQQNIIVFDDTTNRVLIGYQTVLQQWGLFVSQPGVDVTMANADQLIFNSEQDVFKIIKSGSAVIPACDIGNTTSVTIDHNLGFAPAFLAYISYPAFESFPATIAALPTLSVQNTGLDTGKVAILTDVENVTDTSMDFVTQFNNINGYSGTIPESSVQYYLLQESSASS